MQWTHNEPGAGAIRSLGRGETLFTTGTSTGVWRILSGAVRLDHADGSGSRFLRLATAGDCVGEETLAGAGHVSSARAVVRCLAQQVGPGGGDDGSVLAAGILRRHHERFLDLVRLRTGTTPDRLRCLFAMLAGSAARAAGTFACPMPTLADLAAIVDAAPETVSRALGDLRRGGVLLDRNRSGVIVDGRRLHGVPGRDGGGDAAGQDRPASGARRRGRAPRRAAIVDLETAGAS